MTKARVLSNLESRQERSTGETDPELKDEGERGKQTNLQRES